MSDLRKAILNRRNKQHPSDGSWESVVRAMIENTVGQLLSNLEAELRPDFEQRIGALFHEHLDKLKGEKGDPGKSPTVDLHALAAHAADLVEVPAAHEIAAHVKVPVAKVDEESIARRVAALIPAFDAEAFAERLKGEISAADATQETVEKEKLRIADIEGLENFLNNLNRSIRESSRGKMIHGGGDVVAAGTNVTISKVHGISTISTTGGGGFSTLAATETPTAALTVFTFATAAAQPSYLVVDNVWQKATTAAGTVNWTWNNVTKKATLTIPPADDIWAVV